jgi:hypothetical protein
MIPTAIAAPARFAILAAAAGSASLVVNWRMMIDPDPARSSQARWCTRPMRVSTDR